MAFYIKNKEGQILISGGSLEIGDGLKVEEGVLKANVGSDITVDNELKTDSTNPVENQVITQRLQEIDLVTAAALNDLNDKKVDRSELKTVAFTGDYYDLENRPEEFSQQQSDWNETDITSPTYIQNKPEKLGGIDNIEVNGIPGETKEVDELVVASVELTGLDVPVGEDFVESTATNENLLIKVDADDPTIAGEVDTVSSALGKLQKALKDDEAAITRAFLSVENATGFNDNLEYDKSKIGDDDTILNVSSINNLMDADNALSLKLRELITFKTSVLDVNKINFVYNTRNLELVIATANIGVLPQGGAYKIEIPLEGNTINLTNKLPLTSGYYSIDDILNSEVVRTDLKVPLIDKGRCITFEVSDKVWETYRYVGPSSNLGLAIAIGNWQNRQNWKKLEYQETSLS